MSKVSIELRKDSDRDSRENSFLGANAPAYAQLWADKINRNTSDNANLVSAAIQSLPVQISIKIEEFTAQQLTRPNNSPTGVPKHRAPTHRKSSKKGG